MMMIPFLIIGALFLPYLLRWLPEERRNNTPVPKRKRQISDVSDALAILEARYARGEINRSEYLEMRDDLEP